MSVSLSPARRLDVTPDAYHRLPGFSASLAKVLIARCAEVARDAYERKIEELELDEEMSDDKQERRDRGNVLHALVLGKGGERIAVVPADVLAKNGSLGTDKARLFVSEARKAGKIPIKPSKMEVYEAIARAIKIKLASVGHDLDGVSELAIAWTENTPNGPVDCRGMLDHVVMWGMTPEDRARSVVPGATIYDLKIVDDASPDRSQRTAYTLGYDIQATAYMRALTALYPQLGGRIEFKFLFIEPRRPYALWDPRPGGSFRVLGERRWLRALHQWGEGLATKRWADYRTPERVEIEAPGYALSQEGIMIDVE